MEPRLFDGTCNDLDDSAVSDPYREVARFMRDHDAMVADAKKLLEDDGWTVWRPQR